jgi:hypothetical protein
VSRHVTLLAVTSVTIVTSRHAVTLVGKPPLATSRAPFNRLRLIPIVRLMYEFSRVQRTLLHGILFGAVSEPTLEPIRAILFPICNIIAF